MEEGYDITGGYSKRYSQEQSENLQNSSKIQNQSQQGSSDQKRNFLKTFAIFFGTIIVIGIILGTIYSLGGFTKKISDNKLIEGATLDLSEDNNVKFKVGDENHGIAIDFIGTDSVELTISSDPIKLNMKINEIQEVDINNDGITDILVKITKISDGKAEVAIRKIENLECLQDWTCTDWTTCSEGIQERTCSDLNSCDGTFGKPPEKKRCEEMNNINWTNNGNWSRERFEKRIEIQKQEMELERENLSEEEYEEKQREINKSWEEYLQKERLENQEQERITNETRERIENGTETKDNETNNDENEETNSSEILNETSQEEELNNSENETENEEENLSINSITDHL